MKKLLFGCILLQGLFLQTSFGAIIRAGSFRPIINVFSSDEYPTPLYISGDGFSGTLPLMASFNSRPTDGCCYRYGSTYPVDFFMTGGVRYRTGGTGGLVFNGSSLPGEFLFGYNTTFGGMTPEDNLFQSPARENRVRIIASPITFPNPVFDVPRGQGPVLTGTFELTGSLCGYPTGSGTMGLQPCVFDMPTVYGRGTYELKTTFGSYQGPNFPGIWSLDTQSFIFTFADPGADVPEPATWAMLAFGLVGVSLFRKSKRS